jgi:hypothetical protein
MPVQSNTKAHLVAPQHALDQVAQRTPVVLAACEVVLIDEQHVLLKAGVEVWLQTQFPDDGVVVAVDVCIHPVHALEDLPHQRGERLGEGHADAGRQHRLVVDVALHPAHQLLDVGRGGHLGRSLVVLVVLPEIFEPRWETRVRGDTYA